jgi:site-specific recombinase XerC
MPAYGVFRSRSCFTNIKETFMAMASRTNPQNPKLAPRASKTKIVIEDVPSQLDAQARYEWMAKRVGLEAGNEKSSHSWQHRLAVLVKFYGAYRSDRSKGVRLVSHATMQATHDRLFQSFQLLWDIGYAIKDPANISQRHVRALVAEMIKRGLSDSVIQNRLSMLRKMCSWLGKHDVVLPTATYATEARDLKRTGVTDRDKSVDGAGVDPTEVVEKALSVDPVFGMQLSMQMAFGLRVKEAVMFSIYAAERSSSLWLDRGTKGGLGRSVPIETDTQRAVLNMVREFMESRPHLNHLGWPERSLDQSRDHFYYLADKIGLTRRGLGVTSHGFRHGYVHQLMISKGLIPPVKGGRADQLPPGQRNAVLLQASRALGHSRVSITPAYSGSFAISVTPRVMCSTTDRPSEAKAG